MGHEFFSNVIEASRDALRHLGNARIETLLMTAGVIALLAYFLLRGR